MRFARSAPSFWLLLSTVVVVVAFLGTTLYAWHRASVIDDLAEAIATDADPSIRHLDDARTELHATGALVTSMFFDAQKRTPSAHEAFERHKRRMRADVEAYTELPFFPAELARWHTVDVALAEAEAQLDAVVAKLDAGDLAGAAAVREGQLGDALERADVALGQLVGFQADQASRLGNEIAQARRSADRTSWALHAIAATLAIAMLAAAARASQRYLLAVRRASEADAAMTRKLESVAGAALAIAESISRNDLREVLQLVVDAARKVANADLAALGMGTDPSQPFDPFVYAGVSPSLLERFGAPRPVGVLGAVIQQGATMREEDVTKDARFAGLPESHPPIGPFLGTVVRHAHEKVGHLYLARRPGEEPFTEQDARAVELLGAFAATAVQNAELYAALRREVSRREDMLSIVSHDLRNPLSGIGLAARLLQRRLPDEAPVRRQADVIVRNASRMDRMISDLLAAAKLQEGGVLAIEPKAQEVGPLVRETVEAFAAAAAEKGVALRVELTDPLPPAFCDAGRIGQVLSNLVGNALKFTPRGGSVIVSVSIAETDRGEVRFSVRDTGVGIPEAALPHVFERFWQEKEHASRGTGLGLYIAKGIIDAHRGRIWVTSRVGEGSDFEFTVPAASWMEDARADV